MQSVFPALTGYSEQGQLAKSVKAHRPQIGCPLKTDIALMIRKQHDVIWLY
jgi:hypothetical protein